MASPLTKEVCPVCELEIYQLAKLFSIAVYVIVQHTTNVTIVKLSLVKLSLFSIQQLIHMI